MTPLLVPLHGIGTRQDLPLPFEFVLAGAAAALVISFTVLVFAWRRPRWQGAPPGITLAGFTRLADSRWFRGGLAAIVLLVWGVATLALWFGQDRVTNPVFGFVYVWLWVGLVPLSVLLGPVWRVVNPVRTLYRLVCLLPGVRGGRAPLPAGAGIWPAAVGLAGFSWLELVQPDNNTLGVLRVWAVIWFLGLLGGALRWGEAWIAAADPFEAFASLAARLSAWRRLGGTLRLVNPLRNLVAGPTAPGTAAAVCVLLGGTAFDSFGSSTGWIRAVQGSSVPPVVAGTAGLLAMIALVAVTFTAGVAGMRRHLSIPELSSAGGAGPTRDLATDRRIPAPASAPGGRRLPPGLLDTMATSVIPIVLGYALGHYASLLVLEGQRTAFLLSDPLGLGWNLFGTAELGIAMLWLDYPTATALIQLVAIVGGHLLGVLVAHELAVARLEPGRAAIVQLPLLLVMVGYTLGGLVLLFSP